MVLQKSGDAGERLHEDRCHLFALRSPDVRINAATPAFMSASRSTMSIPDAMVFGQDNPAALPGLDEPVFVFGIGRKVVVVDVERGASLPERCSDTVLPQRTIEEEDGRSGRFDGEFAPDGFFDFEPPPSIIVCQVVHGFAGLVAFRDHSRWNTGACQHRPAKGYLWIDDDGPGLFLEVAFPRERIESDRDALEISFDSMEVCLEDFLDGQLSFLRDVDQLTEFLDEEVESISVEFLIG